MNAKPLAAILLTLLAVAPITGAEDSMKAITLETAIGDGKDQQVAKLYETTWTKLWQITLRNGKPLAAHVAKEAVTIHCLSGKGVLIAGDERVELHPGVVVALEPNVTHAIESNPAVSVLVTRFLPPAATPDEHEH